MKTLKLLEVAVVAGLSVGTTAGTAQTIYESASLGPTGITVPVVGIDYDQFLGARFEIRSTVQVTHIGGHLNSLLPGPGGTLFGAIIRLKSMQDLPDGGHPFGPAHEVMAATTFNPGQRSVDFLAPLPITLPPGIYGLVFGAGEFGSPKAAHGGMPSNNTDLPGASYFTYNGKEHFEEWVNGGFSNVRFVVKGFPASPGAWSFHGNVLERPASGLSGDWRIADWTVRVTQTTRWTQENGPVSRGACVRVSGRLLENTVAAEDVEVLSSSGGCGALSAPELQQLKFHGAVQRLPQSGLLGDWLVGGRLLRVSAATQMLTGNRQPSMGVCVEAEGQLQNSDGSIAASRILSQTEVSACAPAGATGGGSAFYGVIESQPAGAGPGDWRIGARTVRVPATASLDLSNGTPAPGACVQVHGSLQPDGILLAARVQVLSSSGTCLFPDGLVNAASLSSQAVAPGLIVSLFGFQLSPLAPLSLRIGADGRVSTRLANVRVLFDGIPAPLLFASPQQINAVVPYAVAGRSTIQVQVENNHAWSNPILLPVASADPAIFTLSNSGQGQGAILNPDGSVNGPANPAPRGAWVSIFATGEGQTDPPGIDGAVTASSLPRPLLPVSVTIGTRNVGLLHAGAAPSLVSGVLQVNAALPQDLPAGSAVPVQLTIGGRPSRDGVTVAIR